MPAARLSVDLAVALVLGVLWSAIDAARSTPHTSSFSALAALLGSTSLILGVGLVSLRRARPFGAGLRAVAAGAALASFPLAVAASVLQRTTHHRALGGVTFAFVAATVIAFAIAVAWRMIDVARREGPGARAARGLVIVMPIASMGAVIAASFLSSRADGAAPVAAGVIDATIGAALLTAGAFFAQRLGRSPSKIGAVAWLCVVLASVAIAVSEPSLCANLASRAPVAFALGAVCGS